jgi:hypothetical protein
LEEFRKLANDHEVVLGMTEKCAGCAKEFYNKIGAKECLTITGMTIMMTLLPLKSLKPMMKMGMTSNLPQRQKMLANA